MEIREQPEVGLRIRELREATGMGQGDLASAIGMSQPDVSKIERGERSVGAAEIFRIADALGVAADDVLLTRESRELQVAFRREGESDDGARRAIDLIEQSASRLDQLRALLP